MYLEQEEFLLKGIISKIFKFLLLFVSLILTVLIIVGIWYGIHGYKLYRDAVDNIPLKEKVTSIHNKENYVTYDQLPEIYITAVVSAEDKRFWEHSGVDLLAICRAMWNDIRTLSFVEGGSTITQQFIKNVYFTQEKKLERKVAELFAAWEMEKTYEKEEIFELYVNTIYFGSGYYGIFDAAKGYFGKEPSELTDYKAILLAGLPNAPSVYSPDVNPELAVQRMQQVLDYMLECDALSETEVEQILSQ